MKLKLFTLFLLVFAAIGQTIFLNIDAKSIFLEQKIKNSYTNILGNDLEKSLVEPSEVVVTIRQQKSEATNQDVSSDTEEIIISTESNNKKPCVQRTKKERLLCQKAKEKEKQRRISGSNPLKSSTIQQP
ncbi:hypothetical protein Fleli_0374 [Bernardetia litoralis DSM 6794]|uniref:Uncharacterized protein n=1 Tax=Bernardetia litoralis (strain ATCC 23117 / DSM 6794 / NBRC 15988 / NCIMB 1366 / Fx l1 / Sio-4) TaxID=880071 RepID=I4AFW9_BERLS|nr:hypothetical protein [Bernardetia litoralis]AFM02854.1 hypothetical protein Fleli_0374 [Bernardetia litoralis DSM 6794]